MTPLEFMWPLFQLGLYIITYVALIVLCGILVIGIVERLSRKRKVEGEPYLVTEYPGRVCAVTHLVDQEVCPVFHNANLGKWERPICQKLGGGEYRMELRFYRVEGGRVKTTDLEAIKRIRQLAMHLGATGHIRSCAPPKQRGVELGLWSPTADAIAKECGVDPRDVESLIQHFAPKEDFGKKIQEIAQAVANDPTVTMRNRAHVSADWAGPAQLNRAQRRASASLARKRNR